MAQLPQDADQSQGNQPAQVAQQTQSGGEALPPSGGSLPGGASPKRAYPGWFSKRRRWVRRVRRAVRIFNTPLVIAAIGLLGIVLGALLGFYIPIKYAESVARPPDTIITDLMVKEAKAATTADAGKREAIIKSIYDSNAVVADASCLSNTPAVWQKWDNIIKRYQLVQAQKIISLYHVQVAITWNPSNNLATTATATAETIGLLLIKD